MKKTLLIFVFISILNISFAKEILIVKDKGRYKQALSDELKQELRKKRCKIKVVEIKEILKEKASKYDLVIILGTVKAGRANKIISKFHKKNMKADNFIIYITSADMKWNSKEDYDIVSGASKIKKVSYVSGRIIKRANEIFEEK